MSMFQNVTRNIQKARVEARGAARVESRQAALERLNESPALQQMIRAAKTKQALRRGGRTFLQEMFGISFDESDPRYGNYYGEYRPTEPFTYKGQGSGLPEQQSNVKYSSDNQDAVAVSKKQLTVLSDQLTNLLNAFSELSASQQYIADINNAINKATVVSSKEGTLEARSALAPVSTDVGDAGNGIDGNIFAQLAQEINKLSAVIDQNGIGGGGQAGINPMAGRALKAAGIVGATAFGAFGIPAAMKAAGVGTTQKTGEEQAAGDKAMAPRLTSDQKARASIYTKNLEKEIEEAIDRSRSSAGGGFGGGGSEGGYGGQGDSGAEQGTAGSYTAGAGMKGLLDLIAKGEGGYNSMNQGGADQGSIRGSTHNASRILGKNLPEMTVGEVKRYQALPRSHPQRLFAAGRYQIIPTTMRAVTQSAGVRDNQLFDEQTQDKLGAQLVLDRKPASDYIQGKSNDSDRAVVSLAQEWASLPNLAGRSYYPPHRQTPHTVSQVKAALDAARTNRPVTVGGSRITGGGGGGGGTTGTADGTRMQGSGAFVHPTSNARITSRFGPRRSPTSGASRDHKGVDFGPRTPGTTGDPIYSSADGSVSFAGNARGYGAVIYVDHSDGYQTRYAHLNNILVRHGQRVTKGEQIGKLGNTGIGTGPHLHFEIRRRGTAINPLSLLSGGTVVPDPDATEPANQDSGRNVSSDTDKGPRQPIPTTRAQVDAPAAEVAIQRRAQKASECDCGPTIIAVGGGEQAPGPEQYLTGVKRPSPAKPTARNPIQEYRMYFAA